MNLKKKGSVLLLCYYFPPMGMGGTQRSAKFAKYLEAFGWKPTVVTVKDVHYYAHDESLLEDIRHVEIVRTESLDPLRILARLKGHRNQNSALQANKRSFFNYLNSFIGSWLFIPDSKILWLPFAIIKSIRLILQKRVKVIYTTSPPHSAHLAGVILKMLTRVKWIADFRDDWTGGESQPCPTRFHLLINRFQEKLVLKYADKIIAMCEPLEEALRKKCSDQPAEKFDTIMNGYDSDDFTPVINEPLSMTFTITHCGSISKVSNPEPFLKGFKNVLQQYPETKGKISVQFIGTDIFGILDHLVREYSLAAYIKPIRYLPHEQALRCIMASHVLLITVLKKTDEEIITGKIFEYLGSGKQIVMISNDGYVPRLIKKLGRGVIISDDDIQGISNAIYSYFSDFQKRSLKFAKPLSVIEFDRRKLTAELASIFDDIVK